MRNRFFLPAIPLGLLTLGIALTMPRVPALEGVRNAIVELEFARSGADILRILGEGPTIREAVMANVAADQYFLVAYSLFLAVSCWSAWRWRRKSWLWAGAGLSLAAGFFDYAENQQLLYIVEGAPFSWEFLLLGLAWFTAVKWSLIVAVLVLLGVAFYEANALGRWFCYGSVLAVVLWVTTIFIPAAGVLFATLIGMLFLGLWILEVVFTLRKDI